MKEKKPGASSDNNLFENIYFKLFPYWPIFILLSIVFLVIAFAFSRREKPTYTVGASIAINDEEAGTSNNQPIRALNAFSIRQTVDNEVLVLQSRALMKQVVNSLHLYAPLGQQGRFSEAAVYSSAPITVEAIEPDSIKRKVEKVYFSFDPVSNTVEIQKKRYPLNQWVRLPYATLRFVRNTKNPAPKDNHYFFSLLNPTSVASGLLGGLTVTSVSKLSTVINLGFQAENPEKAADVLNELLRQYMHRTVEYENQLAASTLAFVEQRLQDVENDLDSIERRIQQFRTARGVIDLSQQGRLYLENVAGNDRRTTEINTQLAVLEQVERYVNAEGRGTGIVPTSLGISDPVLAQLLQRLNDLELQRANLRTTTGDNNPLVTSVESEILKIRPNIRNIVANQRSRLEASRNNLTAASNRVNSSIQNIPAQERQLLEISRQQAVKRDLYSFLLQRREEAALSNSSNIANSQVIDWAEANAAAVSSKKMFYLLGGVIAAFALAIGYIIFREALNGKVLFRSAIEKLTIVPVIGEHMFVRRLTPLMLGTARYKLALEQFRRIQAALGLFASGPNQRRILVTSSVANEGKTVFSSHFAASLALSGKKVILVDMNMYRPESSRLFGMERFNGLSDFLAGKFSVQELVKDTELDNLHILPAGNKTDNPLELLMQEKLTDLMSYLDQHYDHIIFDTPPVELAADAYILANYSHIPLYVIRYGVTPQSLIRRMDEDPRMSQIEHMKIIYNGIKGREFLRKYYGFGFGYGKEQVFSKKAYTKTG